MSGQSGAGHVELEGKEAKRNREWVSRQAKMRGLRVNMTGQGKNRGKQQRGQNKAVGYDLKPKKK